MGHGDEPCKLKMLFMFPFSHSSFAKYEVWYVCEIMCKEIFHSFFVASSHTCINFMKTFNKIKTKQIFNLWMWLTVAGIPNLFSKWLLIGIKNVYSPNILKQMTISYRFLYFAVYKNDVSFLGAKNQASSVTIVSYASCMVFALVVKQLVVVFLKGTPFWYEGTPRLESLDYRVWWNISFAQTWMCLSLSIPGSATSQERARVPRLSLTVSLLVT